jgi:hypothetical protein
MVFRRRFARSTREALWCVSDGSCGADYRGARRLHPGRELPGGLLGSPLPLFAHIAVNRTAECFDPPTGGCAKRRTLRRGLGPCPRQRARELRIP